MSSLRCLVERHLPLIRRLAAGASFVVIAALAPRTAWTADVSGSRDPLGIARFPHADIVRYLEDDEESIREFVVSQVDRKQRELRVEREIRTPATLESATYEMPAGARLDDVIEHYVGLLGPDEVFRCRARGCGRSNDWANAIFEEAILYGPDRNQFYLAGDRGGKLVSVYVIERGNKRIYAHVQVLTPSAPVAIARDLQVAKRLGSTGMATLNGVRPAPDGSLPEEARQALTDVAADLQVFGNEQIYVVCHLYGSAPTAELLKRSERCAEEAVRILAAVEGPEYIPFAAGPLLPRTTGNVSRIELVLPRRLTLGSLD